MPHNTTIALVTGANKGIGRAIAQRLAETGMTVLIAARAARRGGAAAAALRAVGAHPVVLDVTAPATIEAAAAQVADRFGRLDGGAHLFEDTSQVPLTLLESRPHGNGIVALRYARPYDLATQA